MDKDISKIENAEDIAGSLVNPKDQTLNNQNKIFKKAWNAKYVDISKIPTKHKKKKRKVGKEKDKTTGQWKDKWEDYLEEQLMRNALDELFPGWSLKAICEPIVINNRLVLFLGDLIIIDIDLFKYLVANGIPKERALFTRSFPAAGGGMYHFSKETGNVIHESNPHKKAVTEGLKYAINRLTHYGDDTYRKEDPSTGLSTSEIKDLVNFVNNSLLSDNRKEDAIASILDLASNQIEAFKQFIKEEEDESSSLTPE